MADIDIVVSLIAVIVSPIHFLFNIFLKLTNLIVLLHNFFYGVQKVIEQKYYFTNSSRQDEQNIIIFTMRIGKETNTNLMHFFVKKLPLRKC